MRHGVGMVHVDADTWEWQNEKGIMVQTSYMDPYVTSPALGWLLILVETQVDNRSYWSVSSLHGSRSHVSGARLTNLSDIGRGSEGRHEKMVW